VPGLAVVQAGRAWLDDVVGPWAWQVTAALGVMVAARSA
jgi:hypothetical protein